MFCIQKTGHFRSICTGLRPKSFLVLFLADTSLAGFAGNDGVGKHRVHHHKRHLSRSSSSVEGGESPPRNSLINELGDPANMFVTENGTVVTSQIGGTAILPCATAKLGTATVSTEN